MDGQTDVGRGCGGIKTMGNLQCGELKILPWTKILNLDNLARLKSVDHEILSWLFCIPAGLTEIHTHMKYQLATTNRS